MDFIKNLKKELEYLSLRHLSLRQAMVAYFFFVFTFVVIVYFFTVQVCDNWITIVQNLYFNEYPREHFKYTKNPITIEERAENNIWIFYKIKQYSLAVYMFIGICFSTHLYYKEKLKQALYLLHEEALHISQNDFGFSCRYDSRDEMGEICQSFETMRLQMVENKEELWKMMEDQRQVNAAFAHDLRTPLTVMRGYIDMIEKYYPLRLMKEEKMMEILKMLGKQVNRMEKFSNTMKELHGIDEITVKKVKGDLQILCRQIEENAKGFTGEKIEKKNKNIEISVNALLPETSRFCYFDETVILEVFDNLLGNANRFAKKRIEVTAELAEDMFMIFVKDDGCGFSKNDLELALQPYYSGEGKDVGHFGLGLTIAKKLCKKHGGEIKVFNSIESGAIVCVSFCIKK